MKIKCPTCNTMIDLDENSYNEIVAQVKNEEVEREVRIQTDALKAKYEAEKKSALLDANQANQKAIAELKAENEQLKKNNSTEIELAKAKAKAEQDKVIQELQGKLTKIQGEVELAKKDAQLENQALKDKFRRDLEMKDEEVERWKNFRMGDSTKDLGESLEKYCADRFEEMRGGH